jgi:hypothetical protein
MTENNLDQQIELGWRNDGHPAISIPANQLLADLINQALYRGIISLGKSNNFAPFVLRTVSYDEYSEYKYHSRDIRTATKNALESIDSLPGDVKAYALVLRYMYPVGNNKSHDAILIEAGERGQEEGYQFLQFIKPKGFLSDFAIQGDPLFLGKIPQRLK